MGQGDYSLTEFAHRLAQSEAKYGKEILEIIECFTNSRVDLPVKKLEDLSRARMKCARHLLKIDFKKEECINLWKLCNIYSTTAVDVDNAMRDIRSALRKRLKPKDTYRDVSAFRRLIDEYRPAKKAVDLQEIYDKPTSKEKQRWMELNVFGKRKGEKRTIENYTTIDQKSIVTPRPDNRDKDETLYISEPLIDSQLKSTFIYSGIDHREKMDLPASSPRKLRSFLPNTRPPPHPPYTKPITTTKTSCIRNNKFNVAGSPTEALGRKVNSNSSSKPKKFAESEIYDTPSLLPLLDDYKIATEPTFSPLSSPSPRSRPASPQALNNLHQPVAPPRLNALKAKTTAVVPNQSNGTHSVCDTGEAKESEKNADITYSHTLIKIFPSYGESAETVDNGAETTNSKRPGVLAKQHLIEIDSNFIKQDDVLQKMNEMISPAVSQAEFGIIVNRL